MCIRDRLETEQFVENDIPFNLAAVLNRVNTDQQMQAGKKKIDYVVDWEKSELDVYKRQLLIGVIIAFVMALIKKTKLKSVKSQVTAGAYEKACSLDLTVRTDYFVNRVVTTRKIERKQESGGSSVHTGSSGKSHGGRSGKF